MHILTISHSCSPSDSLPHSLTHSLTLSLTHIVFLAGGVGGIQSVKGTIVCSREGQGSATLFVSALRLAKCALLTNITNQTFADQQAWQREIQSLRLTEFFRHLVEGLTHVVVSTQAPLREHDYTQWTGALTAIGPYGASIAPRPPSRITSPPTTTPSSFVFGTGVGAGSASDAGVGPGTRARPGTEGGIMTPGASATSALRALYDLIFNSLTAGILTIDDMLTRASLGSAPSVLPCLLEQMIINPALVEYQQTLMAQPVARSATLMGYAGETSDPSELSYCWQRVLEILIWLLRSTREGTVGALPAAHHHHHERIIIEATVTLGQAYPSLLALPFTPSVPDMSTSDDPFNTTPTDAPQHHHRSSRLTIRR